MGSTLYPNVPQVPLCVACGASQTLVLSKTGVWVPLLRSLCIMLGSARWVRRPYICDRGVIYDLTTRTVIVEFLMAMLVQFVRLSLVLANVFELGLDCFLARPKYIMQFLQVCASAVEL